MKKCDTCIYRNENEYHKPCIVYRDDCEYYKKERGDMTDDLISRQAVQDYIAKYLSQYLYNDVREAVEVIDEYIGELPPVNPQEPKTGHWILDETDNSITCDKCGCLIWANDISNGEAYYCPNCGARMEADEC